MAITVGSMPAFASFIKASLGESQFFASLRSRLVASTRSTDPESSRRSGFAKTHVGLKPYGANPKDSESLSQLRREPYYKIHEGVPGADAKMIIHVQGTAGSGDLAPDVITRSVDIDQYSHGSSHV